MLALAIECSTARASIAIQKDTELLYEEFSTQQKTHSEFLNAAIARALNSLGIQLNQFDIFACTHGPGSFTGIRVASSISKTFCMTFKKPLFVMDSLRLMADGAYQKNPDLGQILCLINAHKNMVYAALYKNKECLLEPTSLLVADIEKINTLKLALGLGDGFISYGNIASSSNTHLIIRDPAYSDFPDAKILANNALLALKHNKTIEWNLYKPLYIRDSEAEEVLKLKTK